MILRTVLVLFIVTANVYGQSADPMDTTQIYTSLEQALKNPQKVYKLSLRKNKLKKLPPEIITLTNLRFLDLSKNKIVVIPAGIGELKNLQQLILSRNHIETLPKEIGNLKNLKYLNINQNDLMSLPSEMAELENLESLDLWSNNIDAFPQEMRKLKKLKTLDLRVIYMNEEKQKKIQAQFPNTKIYFSNSCKCEQ